MNPKISIIVPVYNVEKFLHKCVDSLLAQTYPSLEIILVDDGSPDECPSICDEYAATNLIVKVYHKPNGGLGDARNYGVKKASADWICFVDSDDYVLPNYVLGMWSLIETTNADMVTCGITREDESGKTLSTNAPTVSARQITSREFFFGLCFGQFGHRAYAKIIKKDLLLQHPFPKGYFEDFGCMYLIADKCNSIVIGDNRDQYRYIQRQGSILNRPLSEQHLHAFDICATISNYIELHHPELQKYIYLLYQGQLIQILNKQSMTKQQFASLFYRYRKMFKKGLRMTLCDTKIKWKVKCYSTLLCTTPFVYSYAQKVLDRKTRVTKNFT